MGFHEACVGIDVADHNDIFQIMRLLGTHVDVLKGDDVVKTFMTQSIYDVNKDENSSTSQQVLSYFSESCDSGESLSELEKEEDEEEEESRSKNYSYCIHTYDDVRINHDLNNAFFEEGSIVCDNFEELSEILIVPWCIRNPNSPNVDEIVEIGVNPKHCDVQYGGYQHNITHRIPKNELTERGEYQYYSIPLYESITLRSVYGCETMLAPCSVGEDHCQMDIPLKTIRYMCDLAEYLYSMKRIPSPTFRSVGNCCS